MAWWVGQVGILLAETCLVAGLVLWLFRLRHRFGFAPFFLTLGVMQVLQNLLSLTIEMDLGGIQVFPGSMILFPVTLFAVLLVYIREDASEARHLVYGLVGANLAMSVLWALFAFQLTRPGSVRLPAIDADFFAQNAGMSLIGIAVLLADALLVIRIYEALGKFLNSEWIQPRIFLTLAVVLLFDSVVFVTAVFFREADYVTVLQSNLLVRTLVAAPLAVMMGCYLTLMPVVDDGTLGTDTGGIRIDGFRGMSYRERYESMREQVVRDPLTGLYNRGFFDEVVPLTLERSRRSNQPTSLLMIDIDDFKQLNDTHGHLAGDAMLRRVGEVLQECARSEDAPCRFGGDEFALLLVDADGFSAIQIGERIRASLAEVPMPAGGGSVPLAVTIGVATFPTEATSTSELIMLADRRLYRGKHRGGDALVDGRTTSGVG